MNIITLIVSIIILIIDQITKLLVINIDKEIIPNILYLTYAENKGVAWSLFSNTGLLIIIISIILLIFIIRYMKNFKLNNRNKIAFGLLIGGLLGNLLDRIIRGYVIDFINIYIFSYDYPIFNIADTSIVIGAILLIIAIIRKEDSNDTKSRR